MGVYVNAMWLVALYATKDIDYGQNILIFFLAFVVKCIPHIHIQGRREKERERERDRNKTIQKLPIKLQINTYKHIYIYTCVYYYNTIQKEFFDKPVWQMSSFVFGYTQ